MDDTYVEVTRKPTPEADAGTDPDVARMLAEELAAEAEEETDGPPPPGPSDIDRPATIGSPRT